MKSGAASNDPLFWVMHQLFDKAAHVLRLSERYNTHASWFDWDNTDSVNKNKNQVIMTWNGTTPFKFVDFEPYLGDHDLEDAEGFLRNDMIWALLKPDGEALPYVYDSLTTWGDCFFDPIGQTEER